MSDAKWKNIAPDIVRQRVIIECTTKELVGPDQIKDYLLKLAEVTDMEVVDGPYTSEAHGMGWSGWIHWKTSGAHVYSYEGNPALFTVDCYTCKPFSLEKAAEFTKEFFQAEETVWREVDVNDSDLSVRADEYKAGWQRALADYENVKRDLSARAEESRRVIRAGLASDLLPVVDNFAQAVKFQPDLTDAPDEMRKKIEPWLQGILYIEKQFEEAMKQMGVERIPTDGAFDPRWHDAAGEKHEDGRDPGAILEVLVPGWKIGEIVLRPAKVIVQK